MRGAIPPLPNTLPSPLSRLRAGLLSWGAIMGFFLFTIASRPALGFTQLHIEWVRGPYGGGKAAGAYI